MQVAVLGAGRSGRGIAQLCVLAGHDVRVWDADATDVMDSIDGVTNRLGVAVDRGDLAEPEMAAAVDRLDGTTDRPTATDGADVVIENGDGTLDERRAVFAEVEATVDGEAIVASTANDVSLTEVADALDEPGRAAGLRFFDPPEATGTAEVVLAEQTTAETRTRAVEFLEGLDVVPAVVRDGPGLVADRLELALAVEAMRLVDEGVAAADDVDRTMRLVHDHPVGPLERSDRAGLDERLARLEGLADELGERYEPPEILREKVEAGRLGRETGEGFYVWESGAVERPADRPLDGG